MMFSWREAIAAQGALDRFSGFRPSSFEWNHGPSEKAMNPLNSRVSVGFLSQRETSLPITAMGMAPVEFPVFHSSLFSSAQGLSPPYGESLFGSANLSWNPSSWFFTEVTIHGGTLLKDPAWYHLEKAYLELRARKIVLTIGRKAMMWGQSSVGSILLSDNGTSFDSIQLTTLPSRWKGWFDFLGSLKAEAFFTRTDENRNPAHDYFFGWRVGLTPFDAFEINLGLVYQIGGRGVETGSFSDALIEFFGGRRNLGTGRHDSSNVMNRSFAIDFRIPLSISSQPVAIYSEQHLEDCCGSFKDLTHNQYSYLYGITLPSIKVSGYEHAFWLEYIKTADKLYYHLTWTSGLSNRGRLMGHPVGRDAQAIDFIWRSKWNQDLTTLTELGFHQRFRRGRVDDAPITGFDPEYQTNEKRVVATLSGDFKLQGGWSIRLGAGLAAVIDHNNREGKQTWEFGALGLLSKTFP